MMAFSVHVTTQRAEKTRGPTLVNNSVVSLAMERDRDPVSDTEWTHRHLSAYRKKEGWKSSVERL